MTHCRDNRDRRSRFGLLGVLIAGLCLALLLPAARARADGDPASDVLAIQTLFLPADAGVPFAQQTQLPALLSAAARSGYPIRVALIASRTDLGSVTELWRQPQTYAQFLGQELSLVYRGPLLVVMPNGFGLYGVGAAATGRSVLATVSLNQGLGTGALDAVQRLAQASGHPVALPAPSASVVNAGSSSTVSAIAFGVGAALVILAWVASLRAQPIRFGRRTPA